MASIRNIKDQYGNVFYPLTHERAVKDSNGVNLETKLAGLNSRPYDYQSPNGMGYLVLEKDKTFDEQVTAANTIYVVRYDYVLTEDVTMPTNCILEFDGGSISGEVTITGQNTGIKSGITKIFSTELTIDGSWVITEWFAEWFDIIPDSYSENRDDSDAIQAALNAASSSGVKIVRLLDRAYYINTPLVVNSNCSLVGAEHKGTWSNTSSISSTGDAIHLNGTTAIENIIIKNIALFGNDGDNGLQSHCGILADGNGVASIRNIITEDLFILYFKYGIKVSNDNFNAISYIATKSVEITRCTVGIYFDGNCVAGSTPAWINYNIFRDCTITHNRCGGIAITNAKNMLNNIIDNCCIEGNGAYYFIDEYYENGAFGIKLYNRNASPSENNVVCNSYIENNNPHKGGNSPVASEGESSYGGIVSPDNWYKNKMCGTFVINQANISIDNCFISRQYRVISAIDNSYASLKNSSLSYTNKYFQDQITYPIFTTSSKYVPNSFVADNLKIADNTPYYCPFEVIKGEYDATVVFNTGIDYKDKLCHIYKPKYGSIKDGFYTLGNSEIFDPNLNNLGFGVGNTPIDNTAWLKYNCKEITDTKIIKCNVISDITSEEWQSADAYISDNMPDLYFYSENTDASERPKVQLGPSTGRFYIGSNIVFENLIIDLQNTSDSNTEYFFRVYKDKKTLTFKNCHIKYTDAGGGGALVLVYNSNHKFNIKFVNCTFEANVSVVNIINEDAISRLSKIECTEDMGPSFTTIPNICPKKQGNTAGRPVYVKEIGFCYFDNSEGINKPIYAKETDWTTGAVSWVDATGTAV